MKKALRKIVTIALSFAMLGSVTAMAAACGGDDDNTLLYWCFAVSYTHLTLPTIRLV